MAQSDNEPRALLVQGVAAGVLQTKRDAETAALDDCYYRQGEGCPSMEHVMWARDVKPPPGPATLPPSLYPSVLISLPSLCCGKHQLAV